MAKEYLDMTNFETGETVKIKIGVNWALLFAPFLLLIPLFHYNFGKLAGWLFLSVVIQAILIVTAMANYMQEGYINLLDEIIITLIVFYNVGVCYLFFYLFMRGNKLIADMYYKKGFLAITGDTNTIRKLQSDWGLPKEAFIALRMETGHE